MDYQEALKYIRSTQKFGSVLGLERIGKLLELLGNPQRRLKFVHVAGTNGKGSTVAFMGSVLTQAGYRVGMYTSPGLHRLNDRIRIGAREIEDHRVSEIMTRIRWRIDEMTAEGFDSPTEFEIITALALEYFHQEECDIVLLEVGLGGRLDSTNIIEAPVLSVITPVDYDHMDILGSTLGEIAGEKAGILKPGTELVLYPQKQEAEEVILMKADVLGIPVHKVNFNQMEMMGQDDYTQRFRYDNEEYKLTILGEHQVKNAVVAIEALNLLDAKVMRIPHDALKKGLLMAKWPGRFEILSHDPMVVIDGAHNYQGVEVLRKNLERYFSGRKVVFIMGVLKDKSYLEMVREVLPLARAFVTITVDNERALGGAELAAILSEDGMVAHHSETVKDAMEKALSIREGNEIICAFGSLYYIDEVRMYFLEEGETDTSL
ncbi:bifunctional folylpolyglutamate synthase/dihydrofolate synthase [Proteiniclasticum sp. C24MP]|uniref:bifunctional folylpolyglutamate synthase/dihydrofolate synthase n=1 Tax=Proteiniclasticum sp. C24MP TaxID=3374101 RepID=UPI0037550909